MLLGYRSAMLPVTYVHQPSRNGAGPDSTEVGHHPGSNSRELESDPCKEPERSPRMLTHQPEPMTSPRSPTGRERARLPAKERSFGELPSNYFLAIPHPTLRQGQVLRCSANRPQTVSRKTTRAQKPQAYAHPFSAQLLVSLQLRRDFRPIFEERGSACCFLQSEFPSS